MPLHLQDGLTGQVAEDSGPGIDPDELPRVLNRLFRAGNAAAGTRSGLGLG